MPGTRTGALTVRVWTEDDGALRARITQVLDVSRGHEVVSVAGTAEQVLAAVRTWLEEFTEGGSAGPPAP